MRSTHVGGFVLSAMPTFSLAAVVTVWLGAFCGLAWVTGYTLLQENVRDEFRGRTYNEALTAASAVGDDTIQKREYDLQQDRRFYATMLGMVVTDKDGAVGTDTVRVFALPTLSLVDAKGAPLDEKALRIRWSYVMLAGADCEHEALDHVAPRLLR